MLHADLDDEQRAHLTHGHPDGLDSSPSPLSSRTLTYFDSLRSTSPCSHTTTHGSSHLLARLISLEEEVREINTATVVTTQHLEAEKTRANVAERRALHRLRMATESRERAEQESARLREALKLCKLKLENAQTEIFQAQDVIDQVTFQRIDAEAEVGRAGTEARKLEEETRTLVMLAREEGRRMGFQERLSVGRRISYDKEHDNGDESIPERDQMISDGARSDPQSYIQLHSAASARQQSMYSESVPPVHTPSLCMRTPPAPPRVVPVCVSTGTSSHEYRTPSPPRDPHQPEIIHPIPIPPSPIVSNQPSIVPVDNGWIPRANSRTSYTQIPPPHGLLSSSSIASQVQDSRPTQQSEPPPVRPHIWSRDYAYQTPVPPSIQHEHMPFIASRTSTDLSHNDRVNKRPRSSLRNEIYVDRARSESQPFRENTSRNEHRDQDLHHSRRTEADNNAEQWGADDDAPLPPLLLPPCAFTPPLVPHSHQSLRSYDPVEKIVTPPPLWHVNDPRPHIVILTESTAARSYLPPDNPVSHPAPTRWDVSTESTIARSYLPPDDPVTQPAPTQRDIRTESDSLRMPTPLWAIKDPHPRTVVPTESTATPLPPPLYYLPPDDPVFQPAPTRWAVRTESNSCAKSGIGMPAPPQPRMVVPAESTAVPLLPPLYYLPPDNPMSQPAPTQWDIQTESDGLTRPGIGMPMPLWDVKDPQSRTVVPTESTAARLYLPPDNPMYQPAPTQRDVPTESIGALYLPPDDPMSQPAPTQWDIRTESDSLTRPGIGMPMPLWDDVRDPQSRTVDPTESTAVRSHLSLNDPASRSSRAGSPLKYLRQLFRQLRHGSGSNSILNTIVESPALSEPEKTLSPPAMIAALPHILTRGAANQPLPQEDVHQHQHPPSSSHSQSQLPHYYIPSSLYNAPERLGTPWPAL